MSTMIELAAQRQEQRLAAAVPEYFALLERNARPRPGDEDRLAECMGVLGRSVDDLEDDVELVGQIIATRALAAELPAHETARQKACEHFAAVDAECKRELEVVEKSAAAKRETAQTAWNNAAAAFQRANYAKGELSRLQLRWEAVARGVSVDEMVNERHAEREERKAVESAGRRGAVRAPTDSGPRKQYYDEHPEALAARNAPATAHSAQNFPGDFDSEREDEALRRTSPL